MNWKWVTTTIAIVGVYTFISQYLRYVPPVRTDYDVHFDFGFNNVYGNELDVGDIC